VTLPRGFKADAERKAKEFRAHLGLAANERIDPRDLAEQMSIQVVSADTLVSRRDLEELDTLQSHAFSAATFAIRERTIVVVNPLRSIGRQNSDIAHELAHVILEHDLSEVRELNGTPFRTCKPDEEEQATTLGSTLLLPRDLLIYAARHHLGLAEVADQYDVTIEMARYRFNTTGVAKQLGISIQ
jgi:Zn-dependent peptidase ImmA (M78 family)